MYLRGKSSARKTSRFVFESGTRNVNSTRAVSFCYMIGSRPVTQSLAKVTGRFHNHHHHLHRAAAAVFTDPSAASVVIQTANNTMPSAVRLLVLHVVYMDELRLMVRPQ